MRSKERLRQIIQEYTIYEKPIILLAVFIGFIYLNGYLREFGIPFPLEIGILPTLLIVIASLSIFLVLLVLAYVFLVGLVNVDPFSAKFHALINTDINGLYAPRLRNSIKYALISYVFPFSVFLILAGYYELDSRRIYGALFLGYVIWAFLYSWVLVQRTVAPRTEKLKRAFLMTCHVFMVQCVSIVSLSIFLVIVLTRMKGATEFELVLLIVSYGLLNFMCILPIFSKIKFDELHRSSEKLNSDQLILKSQKQPAYAILVVLLLFSLTPNISPFVGELPLKLLSIGGGMEYQVRDTAERCLAWPEFIVLDRDANACVSKTGKLIIQLGDRAFFLFQKEEEGEQIVGMNTKDVITIKALSEKSLFY